MFGQKHAPNAATRGIDVREQINQGFVRSELGTTADEKAERIYDAAEINPVLLKRHANMAVENYMAAISCFLRAIPTVKDVRSKKLLREHVNRLLLRLEGMRQLVKEADRLYAMNGGNPVKLEPWERINYIPGDFDPKSLKGEFGDELAEGFDMILEEDTEPEAIYDRSNMFQIGTDVQVLDKFGQDWKPAKVSGYDKDKYKVTFDDGSEEKDVDQSRVRLPPVEYTPPPEEEISLEHELRMEIMSEIIESERIYNSELMNLDQYFIHVLKNPAHWGGQREQQETLFSQRTLTEQEAEQVFANIPSIIEMHQRFLKEMEVEFGNMKTDQSLASLFVKYAPQFRLYEQYVVQYEESQRLIEKMRKERMGFRDADIAAERARVPSLAVLMRRPIDRIDEYMKQLRKLQERTPQRHASFHDMQTAIELFQKVKIYMEQGVHMKENQKLVKEIERQFSPVYPLSSANRFFLYKGELSRMEEGNAKIRHFWLFNDVLVCGRPSEWLARGAFRHLGTLTVKSFGDSNDYGPLAFFVRGKRGGKWTMTCTTHEMKNIWMNKLALCTNSINETRRRVAVLPTPSNGGNPVTLTYNSSSKPPSSTSVTSGIQNLSLGGRVGAQQQLQHQIQAPPPPPPPPPARKLPPGWVELVEPNSGKTYFFNQSLNVTQWDMPQ